MRKSILPIALAISCLTSANAAVTLVNGDFQTGLNWNSAVGSSPTSWGEVLSATSTNGLYGETVTGYGTGRVAVMKTATDAYYQQVLGGVDAATNASYTINYDGGIRYHSSYSSAARDIVLRVSLWNSTTDTELAFTEVTTAFSNTETSLHAREHTLTYDPTGLAGDDLALRFANVSTLPGGVGFNDSQAIIDNVTIEAVPEPSSAALLGLGWLALILRRRK